MSKDIAESIADLERKSLERDTAAELQERYRLPPAVAERIIEMSSSIDQAHALAELMR